jgi:hypothetical protein
MACEVLHEYCKGCKKSRVAQKPGPKDRDTGKPMYEPGDFIIQCGGIPGDNKFIPDYDKVAKRLDKQSLQLANELYDPIQWAARYLNWKPRVSTDGIEYQALPLRCTSKRKVLRMGRRVGKTDIMAIAALHFLFTNSPRSQRWDSHRGEWVDGFGTALVLTPFLSQVKNLFNRMRKLIELSPELSAQVKRDVSTPYHEIELNNGCKIVGFSAGSNGAGSVRGQKADFILLDEMDYLDEESIDNIFALLMEHGDVDLLCASTPTGLRETFYRFCMERMEFKEFYFSSYVNPSWSKQMEMELREIYNTESSWQHEILAEFGEATFSVFQHAYVNAARTRYEYENLQRDPSKMYAMGVDWNDKDNGTKILILEWDPKRSMFKVVAKESIHKAGWTQTAAVQKIIDLNRVWQPDFHYFDQGFGGMQIEVIKKYGIEAKYSKSKWALVDAQLANVVGVSSKAKIEINDPETGQPIKKDTKPFMIENAVRRFEQGVVEFPFSDEELYKQLIGYRVEKISAAGVPVYEAGPDGDHALDALVLAFLAFQMETSEFSNPEHNASIAFSGKFGDNYNDSLHSIDSVKNPETSPVQNDMKGGVPEPRSSFQHDRPQSTGLADISFVGSARQYTPEAFREDDPGRRSRMKRNSNFLRRGGIRSSRSRY